MLIIEKRDATEVFANDLGNVVIRQISHGGEEDVIAVHPDDVPALIRAIAAAKDDADALRAEPDFILGK